MSGAAPTWESMAPATRAGIGQAMAANFQLFTMMMFPWVRNEEFRVNWHHEYLFQILMEVEAGQHRRLIINCPPGSTKTELVSIHWPAWCAFRRSLGRPGKLRWLPISYSADLVDENGARLRDLMKSEPFRQMTEYKGLDIASKADWEATGPNGCACRVFGTSLMGQATGRRAGYMDDEKFTGALIFDDPLPPKDELSPRNLTRSNTTLASLSQSRLAHGEKTPVLMFQQRICPGDSTDHLMSEKHPDNWTRITIPALIDWKYAQSLPPDIRSSCIRDTGITAQSADPVSYWPDKESTDKLRGMQKADAYFFASQYMQEPDDALLAGVIYRAELDAMRASGRITTIPIEPSLPVITAWDLGINDLMVIWFAQIRGAEIRLVHCMADSDRAGEYWIQQVHEWGRANQVTFQAHYGPHDLAVRELFGGAGKSRQQIAADMGFKFTPVKRPTQKRDGLQAVRRLFPRLVADEDKLGRAWRGIERYHREFNPAMDRFEDQPAHDWASHYADALQTLAFGLPRVAAQAGREPKRGPVQRAFSGGSSGGGHLSQWAG